MLKNGLRRVRIDTNHGDPINASALVLRHLVENVLQVVAAARKSIERDNGGILPKTLQGLDGPLTGVAVTVVRAARHIQYFRVKA